MNGERTPAGGRIDRSRPVRFTFDGRSYSGYAGDTLASALLANGVHLLGRSFKYHRPRGLVAAGVEEPTSRCDRGDGRNGSGMWGFTWARSFSFTRPNGCASAAWSRPRPSTTRRGAGLCSMRGGFWNNECRFKVNHKSCGRGCTQ